MEQGQDRVKPQGKALCSTPAQTLGKEKDDKGAEGLSELWDMRNYSPGDSHITV